MNTKLFALSLAAASLLLAGCDEKKNPTAASATDAMKDAAGKVSETAGKAVDATKDAAGKAVDATKDAANKVMDSAASLVANGKDKTVAYFNDAVKATEPKLEEWGRKIETLPEATKAAAKTAHASLKDKFEAFKRNLADMKNSAGDTWKTSTEKLFGDWRTIDADSKTLQGQIK